MSAVTTTMSPSVRVDTATVNTNGAFFERLWRTAGIQAAGLFVLAYAIHGSLPAVGASAESLVSFYDGDSTRVLIAAAVSGFAVLNLMWFGAAIRTTLTNAGQEGWGAAATAASASFGAMFLLIVTIGAALSLSIAGADEALTAGLSDLAWAGFVLSAFPRAMLIMAGSFGLWRAAMISSSLFAACVGAVILTLLGATTWASDGVWAPHGAYSQVISPAIGFMWIAVATRALTPRPVTPAGW